MNLTSPLRDEPRPSLPARFHEERSRTSTYIDKGRCLCCYAECKRKEHQPRTPPCETRRSTTITLPAKRLRNEKPAKHTHGYRPGPLLLRRPFLLSRKSRSTNIIFLDSEARQKVCQASPYTPVKASVATPLVHTRTLSSSLRDQTKHNPYTLTGLRWNKKHNHYTLCKAPRSEKPARCIHNTTQSLCCYAACKRLSVNQ